MGVYPDGIYLYETRDNVDKMKEELKKKEKTFTSCVATLFSLCEEIFWDGKAITLPIYIKSIEKFQIQKGCEICA